MLWYHLTCAVRHTGGLPAGLPGGVGPGGAPTPLTPLPSPPLPLTPFLPTLLLHRGPHQPSLPAEALGHLLGGVAKHQEETGDAPAPGATGGGAGGPGGGAPGEGGGGGGEEVLGDQEPRADFQKMYFLHVQGLCLENVV